MKLQILILKLLFIFTAVYALISLFKIISSTAPDFSVFYESAVNLTKGLNIYKSPNLYTGLGYPPQSLLPFLPFTLLDYKLAQGVWILGSFLAFLMSLVISLKLTGKYNAKTFMLAFVLAFFSFPTRFTLGMGQVNFYALLCLLLSAHFVSRKNLASLALVLALTFKPHLALILPFCFLAGERKIVFKSLAGYILLTLITAIVFGQNQLTSYFSDMVKPLLVFQGREIYFNQGLGAFFSRIYPPNAEQLTLISSILIYVFSLIFVFRHRLKLWLSLALGLLVFLLVEPLSWQHHYVFLIPIFTLLAKANWNDGRKMSFWGLSYLLVSFNLKSPLFWAKSASGALILSHVFLGTLLLYILGLVSYKKHEFSRS